MVGVEITQLFEAHTAGHGGDVVDVRFGDHGGHGRVDIACLELAPAVRIPQRSKVVFRHRLHSSAISNKPITMNALRNGHIRLEAHDVYNSSDSDRTASANSTPTDSATPLSDWLRAAPC